METNYLTNNFPPLLNPSRKSSTRSISLPTITLIIPEILLLIAPIIWPKNPSKLGEVPSSLRSFENPL
jgi:hypothetical protein